MANTVIFQTQKEDGTWKTWHNVSIPIKYGMLLDEQLDYAVVSLARVKRKLFKPMTKALLEVKSNTEYGGEQSKTVEYFIANDDSFEAPIGSGAYNHELTLIEQTKFLECFQLESLCFTNPGGNDYSSAGVLPLLEQETNALHIEGFETSGYLTPSQIGKEYTLLGLTPIEDMIGVIEEYKGNFEGGKAIKVENASGTTYYSVGTFDGKVEGGGQFVIAEGTNTITYDYTLVITSTQGGTVRNPAKATFVIVGVENKHPLKPWTVEEVIQRILHLVEPIRVGNLTRFLFVPPTDKKAKLFSQIAPEFTFTRMTLREALQAVGGFIHAEPRLEGWQNIVFDFYGEQDRAIIHNYRTEEDKYINETKYRALQSSFGVDQSCTKLDSYQQNLVNRLAWEQATTAHPYKGGEQTLRTESAYIRGEEESSFSFPTMQGIDRIVKFEVVHETDERTDEGEPVVKETDITAYIFEEKVYSNLTSYGGVYPFSKSYALYYTQGGKNINGFFFKAPSKWGSGIGAKYSIANILEINGVKIPTDGKGNPEYDKIKFRLTYVPIYSTRVQQSKPYLNEYLPLPRVLNYNQTDNSVETRFFGENIKGAVARMGNPEKTVTINLRNINNIPKAGQLWDDDYYIVSVSVSVNADLFEVSVGLSKNFNRKSQYIGANSIKRIYEVSEEMVQQRHTIYTDYIVLTKELDEKVASAAEGLFLGELGVKATSSIFTEGQYFSYSEISCVAAKGYTYKGVSQEQVLLPVISSAFGNVMEFTWEYKDNFSAGLKSVDHEENGVGGTFGKEVEYTDYYGRLWSYVFALMSKDQVEAIEDFGSIATPKDLPEVTALVVNYANCYASTGGEASAILERKDSREALKKTYALEFVTDEPTFVLGSAFASKNPLVYSNPNVWMAPRLYVLPYRINKFSTVLDVSDLDKERNLGVAPAIGYNDTPLKHFTVLGKTTAVGGKAWAYVVPNYELDEGTVEDEYGNVDTLKAQHGGELIIGENIDIEPGQTVGGFKGLAIHDVFKYIELKKPSSGGGAGGGSGDGEGGGNEGGGDGPTEPDNPDNPSPPEEPDNPDNPDSPNPPVEPDNPNPPEEPEQPDEPEGEEFKITIDGEGSPFDPDENVLDQPPDDSYTNENGDTVFEYENLEMAISIEGVTTPEDIKDPFEFKKGKKITIYPFTKVDGGTIVVSPEHSTTWRYNIVVPDIEMDGGVLTYNGGTVLGILWGYPPIKISFTLYQETVDGPYLGMITATDKDGLESKAVEVDFSKGVVIEIY